MSKSDEVIGDGKYPLIKLSSIILPERPEDGDENSLSAFYNPRFLESFTPDSMAPLKEAIRSTGLQQPPIVRIFTKNGKKDGAIDRIELVAGERRYRSITSLFEEDCECWDDHTDSWVNAQKLYEYIPCKVLYNIDDENALGVAFQENDAHNPFTVPEEIALVERLVFSGMKQEKIADMLKTNVTWVSQTANFREALPKAAFTKLLKGEMSRHVAVQILSFAPEDRELLYKKAVEAQKQEQKLNLEQLQDDMETADDEFDIAIAEQEIAAETGDLQGARRARKRINLARRKLERAQGQRNKVNQQKNVLKQSHIFAGSQDAGVSPKKAKMLTKPNVEHFWIEMSDMWLEDGKEDALIGLPYPPELIRLMQRTAKAIVSGETEMGSILRNHLVEEGIWEEVFV